MLSPLDYFETVQHRFEQAAAATSLEEFDYNFAGLPIRLRFAGNALTAKLTATFAPHQVNRVSRVIENQLPGLTINIWDSASTGVPLPSPPWRRGEPALAGSLDYYQDRRLQMVFRHKNALSLLDTQENLAFHWYADAHAVTPVQAANPLRVLFYWWMLPRGYALCHGAAVGNSSGAVLIGGKTGAGKSTTTLACLSAGMLYLSDDLVLISEPPAVRAISLYSTAKLNADNIARFPDWRARVDNVDHLDKEKAVFFLQQWIPEQLIGELPLRAIVIPQITGLKDSRLTPLSAARTLTLLAPSSILQVSGNGPLMLKMLARLVQHIPGYQLELGTDLRQVPELIQQLLSRLNRTI